MLEKQKSFLKTINNIRNLCKVYDQSHDVAASLSIATSLRVLLHDTHSSTSLLTQLQQHNSILQSTVNPEYFQSSGQLYIDVIPYTYIDPQTLKPSLFTINDVPYEFYPLNKTEWWNQDIYRLSDFSNEEIVTHTYTRKELVLHMANKEGGAHIDSKITRKMKAFKENTPFIEVENNQRIYIDHLPIFIRLFAEEILQSQIIQELEMEYDQNQQLPSYLSIR